MDRSGAGNGLPGGSAAARRRGREYFENAFIPKFNGITTVGLFLTLVILISLQGEIILRNPLHIVLIAVAISLFGLSSGAALATVVGVPVELPVMLSPARRGAASRRSAVRTLVTDIS